ncbi:MAG: hypothetical protein L3K03_01300 [Thermoplasmata archaeon]|nr:hypothetical protein [Thermoplasmata archaeon]
MSDDTILHAYRANHAGLQSLLNMAREPPVAAKDANQLAAVESILGGLLDLVDRTGIPPGRAERISNLNLMYETYVLTLQQLKEVLDLPRVPRNRGAAKLELAAPMPR